MWSKLGQEKAFLKPILNVNESNSVERGRPDDVEESAEFQNCL